MPADAKGNGGKPLPPSHSGPNARASVVHGRVPHAAKSDRGAFGGGGVRDLLIAAADGYAGGGSSAARRGGSSKNNGAKDGVGENPVSGEFNLHLGGDIDALRRALGEQQRIAIAATHARMNLLGVGAAVASGRQVSQRADKRSAESVATLEALSILNGTGANSRPVSRASLAGVMRPSSRAALLSTRDAQGPSSSRPSLSGRPLSSARSAHSMQYPVSVSALRSAGPAAALRENPQVSDISTVVVPKSYSLAVSAAASTPLMSLSSDDTFFSYGDKTSAIAAVNAIHADVFRVATREIHDAAAVSDAEALAAAVAESMGFGEDLPQVAGPSESESLTSAPSAASSEDALPPLAEGRSGVDETVDLQPVDAVIAAVCVEDAVIAAACVEAASTLDTRLTSPPENHDELAFSSSSLSVESYVASTVLIDQGDVLGSSKPPQIEIARTSEAAEAEALPVVEIPSTPASLWPTDIPKDETPLCSSAPGSPDKTLE